MERQRELAREHWKGSGEEGISTLHKTLNARGVRCRFVGYAEQSAYSPVSVIIRDGVEVTLAKAGDEIEVVTETTPFYGESGGQAGDSGSISTGTAHLKVTSAVRPFPDLIIHRATVTEGVIAIGEAADLKVAIGERNATARNHTATHLLQTALKEVLGEHVKQAGSLVTSDRLRFDFTHFSAMTPEELRRVEDLVNGYIMQNDDVHSREMAVQEAMESGATALFGEKYGDRVRVVRVGSVSSELCGGTHVHAAGDIGFFKILTEAGIAAGVRRIEALTGTGAIGHVRQIEEEQRKISFLIKAEGSDPVEKLEKLLARQKEHQREIEMLQARLNASKSADLLAGVKEIDGVKVLSVRVETADPKGLRDLSDTLKDRIGSGIIVLGCESGGKANLLVAVTADLTARFRAGEIIKSIAPVIGGSGGGKPDLAQAGGGLPAKLPEALEAVYSLIT
jgi:alanyl-tRNA synthetase